MKKYKEVTQKKLEDIGNQEIKKKRNRFEKTNYQKGKSNK